MSGTGRRPFLAALLGGLSLETSLRGVETGQTSSQPYVPKQSDRPEPASGDEPGFRPIFDGKTLNGWEGDPTYWRVENGSLVGEITPTTLLKTNSFIIWRGGKPADFELTLEFKITRTGNSGINYRSEQLTDIPFAL